MKRKQSPIPSGAKRKLNHTILEEFPQVKFTKNANFRKKISEFFQSDAIVSPTQNMKKYVLNQNSVQTIITLETLLKNFTSRNLNNMHSAGFEPATSRT